MPTCGFCEKVKGKASEIIIHQKKEHCTTDLRWQKVIDLDREGHERAAGKLVRQILGVYEPMSEEDKDALREYAEKNKEKIQQKQEIRAGIKKGLKQKLEGKR